MEPLINMKFVVNSLVFSFLGVVILGVTFYMFDKLTPGNLWQEILEKQNMAAAIVVGSISIAMAIIIGLAIHG
ncbi:MAG: DUF350 domain-containing protein [Nitrospinae bacterium]|nr:DUF350 domain-containing protein [Nitrospinota bacterium]